MANFPSPRCHGFALAAHFGECFPRVKKQPPVSHTMTTCCRGGRKHPGVQDVGKCVQFSKVLSGGETSNGRRTQTLLRQAWGFPVI